MMRVMHALLHLSYERSRSRRNFSDVITAVNTGSCARLTLIFENFAKKKLHTGHPMTTSNSSLTAPKSAWERVALSINDRMKQLRLNQASVARRGGVSAATVRSLQNASATTYWASKLADVSGALDWYPDAIADILEGALTDSQLLALKINDYGSRQQFLEETTWIGDFSEDLREDARKAQLEGRLPDPSFAYAVAHAFDEKQMSAFDLAAEAGITPSHRFRQIALSPPAASPAFRAVAEVMGLAGMLDELTQSPPAPSAASLLAAGAGTQRTDGKGATPEQAADATALAEAAALEPEIVSITHLSFGARHVVQQLVHHLTDLEKQRD